MHFGIRKLSQLTQRSPQSPWSAATSSGRPSLGPSPATPAARAVPPRTLLRVVSHRDARTTAVGGYLSVLESDPNDKRGS